MAMDFFASQDSARKKTGRLIIMFIIAVLLIMVMVYLLVAGAVTFLGRSEKMGNITESIEITDPVLILTVGLGTLTVVLFGSIYKMAELRGGGKVVAESMGGTLIRQSSTDPTHRRVLNVVAEMAIASGTPTPPVYIMESESGINAFAAGYSHRDAVIGVTRGCAEILSRTELQGVIAHEFSHILNGDMRLNIRLMGVLHGILIIGIIGYLLLRSSMYAGMGRRSSSNKGNAVMVIIAIGAGLAVIGFVGTFFGNMIKAGVSRQREYLADASAVQFTREPQAIAGALKKIGGCTVGAEIKHPRAPESSHLFFGRAIVTGFHSMFSTHPPLPDRIRQIDPSWDGKFVKVTIPPRQVARRGSGMTEMAAEAELASAQASTLEMARGKTASSAGRPAVSQGAGVALGLAIGAAVEQFGLPGQAHLDYAAKLMPGIPDEVAAAASEPYGSRAVIYALLIDRKQEPRKVQLDRLGEAADKGVFKETMRLLPQIEPLDTKYRLPLVDLAIAALKEMSADQYGVFRRNVDVLIKADDKIDLFEWTLQRILLRNLDANYRDVSPPRVKYYALARLQAQCETLLSVLAYVGQDRKEDAKRAFDTGIRHLQFRGASIASADQCSLRSLDKALDVLLTVTPRLKRRVIHACAECISADREITVTEAELLRAVADSLDCPMPPLLPGQKLI